MNSASTLQLTAAALLCVGALAAPAAQAGTTLSLDTGTTELSHSDYGDSTTTRLTAGYGVGPLSVSVSVYEFQDFDLHGSSDSHLELEGRSAQVNWSQPGWVNFDVGVGLFDWDSETRYQGRTFGKDSGTSAMLEAGVSKSFASLVGIHLGARYVDDFSGESLTSVSAGVRFSF